MGVCAGLEELEAPKLACGGGGKLGMPYAFSSMSVSVSLERARAGDIVLLLTGLVPASLRELPESSRLDQGGIAQMASDDYSLQVANMV